MEEEIHVQREEEAGRRGGAAAAYVPGAMAQPVERGLYLKDRVRWGSVWAGLVVALSAQVWLTAIGFALLAPGQAATVTEGISGLGLWAAIAGFIALFIGGLLASRLAGIAGTVNGLWNGIVLWGLAFTLITILASLGAGGILGWALGGGGAQIMRPGQTEIQVQQVLGTAATGAWWFVLGQFLGLLAAASGGALGARPLTEGEQETV